MGERAWRERKRWGRWGGCLGKQSRNPNLPTETPIPAKFSPSPSFSTKKPLQPIKLFVAQKPQAPVIFSLPNPSSLRHFPLLAAIQLFSSLFSLSLSFSLLPSFLPSFHSLSLHVARESKAPSSRKQIASHLYEFKSS